MEAFLRGAGRPSAAALPPEFADFEGIYSGAQLSRPGAMPAVPGAALAPGRLELSHFLQARKEEEGGCWGLA